MTRFIPLKNDIARCGGYTCPGDRAKCRRFTERGLGDRDTPTTQGDRAGEGGSCTKRIGLVHAGQAVENVNPAGATNAV